MRQITEDQMARIRAGDTRALSRKLKECHVREIRRLFVQVGPERYRGRYGLNMEAVARTYGVNSSTISQVVRRKTWKHVP